MDVHDHQRELATRTVCRLMRRSLPARRAALLVALIDACVAGLRVVLGTEGAAEQIYRLADDLVQRAPDRKVDA